MKLRPRGPGLQPRQDDVSVRGRRPGAFGLPAGLFAFASLALIASIHLSAGGGSPQATSASAPKQTGTSASSKTAPSTSQSNPEPRAPSPRGDVSKAHATLTESPADFQQMLTRYCVSCHNERAKIPAGAPLALEKANLQNPSADADIWEKVVRKIGGGAMPPQGSPTPGAAELTKFATALAANLDDAAAKKNYPGRYVLHRLNRTEYANAVRDLLGVTVDVTELLPSDGGDFGFDNIAAALRTSPMLLERYLTAALRVSDLAVGDASVEPGTVTYSLSTVVTQSQHVEGLPLGTRGGLRVEHPFPA